MRPFVCNLALHVRRHRCHPAPLRRRDCLLHHHGGAVADTPPILRGQEAPNLKFRYKKHEHDDALRLTCERCDFVLYENPKIVAGTVAMLPRSSSHEEPVILLCRRSIGPRVGYWNLPAGFMEGREKLEEAAAREAKEEANADVKCGPLVSIFDISHISQVHIYFVAELQSPDICSGYESQEVRLTPWSQIPWSELAFPTTSWALMHFEQYLRNGEVPPVPSGIPRLEQHETSTNVWYSPRRGGLYYDKSWLRQTAEGQ